MNFEDKVSEKIQALKEALVEIEQKALARIAEAEDAKNIQPYRNILQMEHPCCRCGTIIPQDHHTVMAHLPLHVGQFLTSQFITWCDKCWKDHYGFSGELIQEIPRS